MKTLKYRHFFMSGGMFENCKVKIEYNNRFKWHIRNIEREDPYYIDLLWIEMKSKKRAISICNKNNWKIII